MSNHCGNPDCAKALVKKRGESAERFPRRLYCDNVCRGLAASARRRDERRVCPICRAPYPAGRNGMFSHYCGSRSCEAVLRAQRNASVGWPQITGEIDFGDNGFGNNVRTETFGSVPSRPDSQSLTGCSADMAVGVGE